MRLFSNSEAVRRREPSVLAIAETIAASALSFWLAWRFASIQHIVLASALAPFLLLRTRLSALYALHLVYGSPKLLQGKTVSNIGSYSSHPTAKDVATISMIPFINLLASVKIVVRRPVRSVRAIPGNFFKNIAVIDLCFPPQLYPGAEEIKPERRPGDLYALVRFFVGVPKMLVEAADTTYAAGLELARQRQVEEQYRRLFASPFFRIPYRYSIFLVGVLCVLIFLSIFLPVMISSVTYRWALKSTAVLWLPLIWIVIQARPGTQLMDRLTVMTRSAWSKTMLAYSAFVLLAFTAKLALLFGLWQLGNLNWLGPLGVAATRLAAPLELPVWQAAGALNALLAWLFFFQADKHLLAQGTTEAWPDAWLRREYVFFQITRTTLSLYVIACTFYIAAAVAWETEWPPIRFVLFPWAS